MHPNVRVVIVAVIEVVVTERARAQPSDAYAQQQADALDYNRATGLAVTGRF